MDTYGSPWISMDIHGYQWVSMGLRAFSVSGHRGLYNFSPTTLTTTFEIPHDHFPQNCPPRKHPREPIGNQWYARGKLWVPTENHLRNSQVTQKYLRNDGPSPALRAPVPIDIRRGAEVEEFCVDFGAEFHEQILKCFDAGELWGYRSRGLWGYRS